MQKRSNILRLLLIVALALSMAMGIVAHAQEATSVQPVPADATQGAPEAEGETVEGETAAEEGAEAVEGEAAEGEAAEEASANPLVPLGINTGFLIAQILNFLLIFGLLTVGLWRPLMNMLDNRAVTIQKGLEDAAAAANARRNAEAEAEKVLAGARSEASKVIEEARGRGEEVGRGVEAEARTEAESIRAEARARAEDERNRQLADLRGQVVAIATAMSQRIIGETLDAQRQAALVSDFFAKVPAEAKSLGGNVEVVSAMPLSDAEQNSVKSQITADNVTFSVDPSILGGLILRTESRVVDGSVRSNLSELAGTLR